MATEKQLAANRRNTAKSTGPCTQAGKARSRINALRHGLAAEMPAGLPHSEGEVNRPTSARILQVDEARNLILTEIADLVVQGDIMALRGKTRELAATDRYMDRAYAALKKLALPSA